MAKTKRQRDKDDLVYGDMDAYLDQQRDTRRPRSFQIPEGWELFKFSTDGNSDAFDVVPYVAGKGNPAAKPGQVWFKRSFYIHGFIGPERKAEVCPLRTSGKPCPVCEDMARLRQNAANVKTVQSLEPKPRDLFIFKPAGKKPKLFEGPFRKGFGQLLDAKIDGLRKRKPDHPGIYFWKPKGGKTLVVSSKKTTFGDGGRPYQEPTVIEFEDRAEDLPEGIIAKMPCLDDLINELSYKELKKLYEGTAGIPGLKSKDEENEDKDDDYRSTDDDDNDKDDDDSDDEDDDPSAEELGLEVGMKVKHKNAKKMKIKGVCEIVHISGDGTSIRIKDEEDEVFRAITPKDLEVVEDDEDDNDEDEDEPAPKGKKSKVKDEDDDDDEGEEEEPEPKAKGKKKPKGKKPKDEDDDDDDDDEPDDSFDEDDDEDDKDDDEDEDEEPIRKKRAKK